MTIKKITRTIQLLPKQYDFIHSTKREVLFSGGYGSSKTTSGCYAAFRQAVIPNNLVVIVRKTLTSLKRSTLLTLVGGTNPVLPRGSYNYIKSEGIIKINNGGAIYILGLDDETRIRSMNVGCIFVDEMTELTESEYMELFYRLRLDAGSRQIFSATNPAGPSHWAYKRFFMEKSNDREVITTSSLENTHLPQDYIDSLKQMEGTLYKRYVSGEWVALDDLVFSNFNREVHVKKIDKDEKYEEYFLGIDYGQTHPSALLLVGKTRDRLFVLEEYCKQDPSIDKLRELIRKVHERYPNCTLLYDPSAKILYNDLNNIGITLKKANNDVAVGINRIRTKLNVRNDSTDIVINSSCTNLIREFENYQYKPDSESVKKINDDCLDCLRYVTNEVEDLKAGFIYPQIYNPDEGDDEQEDDTFVENNEYMHSVFRSV